MLVIAIIALRHPGTRVATAGSLTHPPTSSTPATTPAAPTTSARHTTPAPTHTSTAKLPLIVLNNTTQNGLATQAAAKFRAGGWTVSDIGNLSNDIISTCAYYDPSVPGAQAAAEALRAQFPAIKRTVPRFGGLPSGPIVVVLTSDYTAG